MCTSPQVHTPTDLFVYIYTQIRLIYILVGVITTPRNMQNHPKRNRHCLTIIRYLISVLTGFCVPVTIDNASSINICYAFQGRAGRRRYGNTCFSRILVYNRKNYVKYKIHIYYT